MNFEPFLKQIVKFEDEHVWQLFVPVYEMIDNMGTFFFSCTYRCLFILYIVFKSAVVVNIKLAIEEDAITLVIIHK